MKKTCARLAFVAVAGAALVASAAPQLTEAEQEKMIRERLERLGGIVMHDAVGSVALFNCQTSIPPEDVESFFLLGRTRSIQIPFKVEKRNGFSLDAAGGEYAALGSVAGVYLVDEPKLPMSLVAMEAGWALVNMAPLKADSPSTVSLARRADKLFTRVCTVLFGGAEQDIGFSAMKRVRSLEELDGLSGFAISPIQLTLMTSHLEALGIGFPYPETYKRACKEGWAPAPTNDVQRAIYPLEDALKLFGAIPGKGAQEIK